MLRSVCGAPELTATGIVADSHCIPFSFLGPSGRRRKPLRDKDTHYKRKIKNPCPDSRFFVSESGALPLDRLGEDIAVGGILGREGIAAILHAEHGQRLRAVVAHRAAAGRSDPHDAALADGERLPVDLEKTAPREEEVEFLVGLVGVEEAGFGAGPEYLEREFGSRGACGRTAPLL